jgi:UDP-N-acetylglucosamine diphosphorylase/glucosamine-1-phosphate N-acetyltransferase
MNHLVVFEDPGFRSLLPLVYWRCCWDLRIGYFSLLERLLDGLKVASVSFYCRELLQEVAAERLGRPVNRLPQADRVTFINGRLLWIASARLKPAPAASGSAVQWHDGQAVVIQAGRDLAAQLTPEVLLDADASARLLNNVPTHPFVESPRLVRYPWDLVHANAELLEADWNSAGAPAGLEGRICEGVYLLNRDGIHVGAGTVIKPGVVLDAENGPIFIGQRVTVFPNVSIEGPCYIGDDSLIQPGAVLRDAMSIGRRCKVGGELESSIIHGYSNKQHDGFLGHSYVAEWVNLAADTVNSDLKNTYSSVRVPLNGKEIDTGHIFMGLTIGDHSKTGIGQMFPTGAVVGFGSNVATCEFAPKFVPSFAWLTNGQQVTHDHERCLETARRVMARRQVTMTAAEEKLFRALPAFARASEQAGT